MRMTEITEEAELAKIGKEGYAAAARGICRCGVVAVLCYQPLPASPTFSLFFDIYTTGAVKRILISERQQGDQW